jgi:hypothetical protein
VLYYTGVGDDTLTLSRKKEIAEKLVEMRLRYFDSFNNALNGHPNLQRRLYNSIADNMHGLPRLRFTFQRNIKYTIFYWLYFLPKKKIKKILRRLFVQ